MNRIGLIIPSLQSGGMERVMAELAKYFVEKRGVEVHLILYGKSRPIFFSIPENIIIHRPSFVFTDDRRFINTLKTLYFLRRRIKNIQPETILSFGEYWNNFVLLALLGVDIPIFISDRCKPDKSLGKIQDVLRKWLYPRANGVIAQTSRAKEIYADQHLNKNIRVIGNPIYQVSSNGESTQKENIVLTVGRLIKTKHQDRLIKMFKEISPEGWKLVIVGGDALKQKGMKRLKKLVRKLDMKEVVEFTGTVSDIEPYYKKSKIFAFTSSSEGFPNVVGEAMSAGLPVISYDCVAGPSDLIDDGKNGYLIPLYNDLKYCEKLKLLINNPELRKRMGDISRKKIQKFQIATIAEKFYSFITDAQNIKE
ncbi:galactosyltransferase [Aliifodinibius salipaludis]|uniref:Galactosyltransferase n=1 Tax=Fodinibius salipaludis TaxID=2032627 RepID=A0A2A2G8V4_9BACT|nr:glycosyltransferase family 4 protein [Aliifodinibius salipaludis]PAU94031.1 galactosyltransferase [Aliifodinibius salipaludis]